jgi:hypothetical protein
LPLSRARGPRVAQLDDRGTPVGRRLIGEREAGQTARDGLRRHLVAGLEGIEAATMHEQQQIAHHLAGGADLATIAIALAQQARLGERAAVVELGEFEGDHRQALEIARDLLHRISGLQTEAERIAALLDEAPLLLPARQADDDRAIGRQRLAIGNMHKLIGNGATRLNERHRASP